MAADNRQTNSNFPMKSHSSNGAYSGCVHSYGMGRASRQGAAVPASSNSYPNPYVNASSQQQAYVENAPYTYQYTNPQTDISQSPQYVAPITSQPVELQEKKKKKGALFWFLIVLALAALVAIAIIAYMFFNTSGKSARQGTLGQLEGKTEAEIQAELDRVVDEGMFNISIASTVEFADGTSEGELRIENVPGNRYLMRVVILENSTGQQIYETDLIEPNYHIQTDTLDVALSAGSYNCTAMFYAYDPESEELIGQAAAEVLFVVDN